MSGVVKAVGKFVGGVADAVGDVVSAAAKVVKKIWPVIVIAAVTYFTMGAGTGAAAGATAGTGAAAGGTAAATVGPAAGGIGAASGAAGTAAAGGAAGVAASGAAGTTVTGGTVGAGLGGAGAAGYTAAPAAAASGGMTQAAATKALTSNAAYTGNAGQFSTTVAQTVQAGQNVPPSQVAKTTKATMGQTAGQSGGTQASRSTMAQSMNRLGDTLETNVAGMGGTEASGTDLFMSKLSGMGDWMEKHPYLTMMGAQTLSNIGQPSEEELLEKSRQWPGAFFGMERDGTTAAGKAKVTGYAPGTEPDASILSRARAAADEQQSPTVNPVDPRVRPEDVVQPNINQLDPRRRA